MIILPTGPEKSMAQVRGTKVYGAKDTALIRNLSPRQRLPYLEDIQPSWPEGFLTFPPVIWRSSITDI